ncbi:MAG TPA: hybrid sensor histidine kinase/response regulator [Methylomirabilota bacterium]|nr:hybrid sensor histidine kinase/response regulator [Methylomirabilota bacterium]
MEEYYDYEKFAILYVDDEEKSLKYFGRAFEGQFRVLTAANAQEGFRLLEQHKNEIGLLITDQRMPGEKGVQLLERARQLCPRVVRVLVTAYSDLDAAIDAVNTGAIYKYVTKPWDIPQLETTLKRGLEFFIVQQERDQLLREKLSVLHNMMMTDYVMRLGILAAGLGHHVRNPLVAIRTFLDLAPSKLREEQVDLEQLRNPNFWKEFHSVAQAQVKRITELLSDLGEAAEKPSFLFQDRVQVGEVVTDVLRTMQRQLAEKRIVVDNQMPVTLPSLFVDRKKFHRLFELLLKDEISSLPAGSRVSLRARASAPVGDSDSEVQLEIQDDGPGLSQDALHSVFDPFFLRRDDPKELGINLMACYFIVHHHGGKIEVRSRPGGGTTFLITFPVNPQSRPAGQDEQDFLSKVFLNEALWERLLSGN